LLRPIKNNVVVERIEKEKIYKSGIIFTQVTSEQSHDWAKVVAMGSKVKDIKEGDTVLVWWPKATKVKHDDKEYYIVDEEFISMIYDFGD
jgi:chaperonin GroES